MKEGEVTEVVFESTKTFTHSLGLSCSFRQWRANSHCRFLHGYALEVKLTFEAEKLDNRNWVVDFGSMKPIKLWLEDTFDHKTVVAMDDPELYAFETLHQRGVIQMRLLPHCGCEKFAETIFRFVDAWLQSNGLSPRCSLQSVEVREHAANSAICRRR